MLSNIADTVNKHTMIMADKGLDVSRESYVTTDVRDVRGLVSSYLNVPIDGCEVLCKHSAVDFLFPSFWLQLTWSKHSFYFMYCAILFYCYFPNQE